MLAGTGLFTPLIKGRAPTEFSICYVLSSALYGDLPLNDVLAQVKTSGLQGLIFGVNCMQPIVNKFPPWEMKLFRVC